MSGGKACGQCGKPGVWVMSGDDGSKLRLCVDCYYRLTVAQAIQFRMNAAMANAAADDMDAISGISLGGGRIALPPIPQPPLTLHNIRLNNSVVASINTGSVQSLDVNLTYLHQAGNEEAKNALANLIQAILDDPSLSEEAKKELVEQVAFLSEQAVSPAKDRKPGVIKAMLSSIATAAATVTSVSAAWQAAEPILRSIFGFK